MWITDNKRKGEDNQETKNSAKTRRVEQLQGNTHNKTVDLIVLGLAWKTTQAGMREYFEQFGELLICEVILLCINFAFFKQKYVQFFYYWIFTWLILSINLFLLYFVDLLLCFFVLRVYWQCKKKHVHF